MNEKDEDGWCRGGETEETRKKGARATAAAAAATLRKKKKKKKEPGQMGLERVRDRKRQNRNVSLTSA